ncbi:MAG: helix-hairpin-helix domain-containing protein, partial [Clostridiales bacterium]|nr:helix-hairpin-helix domain-containing protein [Clostridiales bacterium]
FGMKRDFRKIKPFLYPAAFVLIAVFAFAYKIVLKGNAGYVVRTVRGGSAEVSVEQAASSQSFSATQTTPASSSSDTAPSAKTVQVYICGAVRNPGVYSVISGTILNEAVEKAGGVTEDAAVSSLNLVFEINANMSFYIPTVKEVEADRSSGTDVIRGKGTYIWGDTEQGSQAKTGGKVNINTADQATLQTLPGIGAVTAKAIIDYRSKNPFKSVNDLKKVSGIGDAKFERVKEYITV